MALSDKLVKLMKKHGAGILAKKKKLEDLGIDVEKMTPKIAKKALAKFNALGKSGTKAAIKDVEKKGSESKGKKAKGKAQKADKAEKKANPDKDDKKKKGKKAKATREYNGQRYTILGYSAGSFLAAMGEKGLSIDEAKKVVKKFATPKPGPAETTIKLRFYDGTSGKNLHGKPAEVDKKDWKQVKAYLGK